MESDQLDRRAQRSRELLTAALTELLHEQRYDLISVRDIITRAKVSRSTFYLHFQDKDDLLASSFTHALSQLDQQPAAIQHDLRLLPALEMFRHVQAHRALYESVVGGRGLEVLFRAGRDYWGRTIEQTVTKTGDIAVPASVLITHVTGAFLNLLKWWLDNRLPYPPERMAAMFEELVMPGVRAVLLLNRDGLQA
jgi:AcrR family transcriptional regulator